MSPSNELAVDKVPLKHIHIKDVKIQTVCFNTVELSITADLWLSLVEVTLGSGFAIELLNFIR